MVFFDKDWGITLHESVLVGLVAVLGLGVSAQWLAWRLRIPSILFLLFLGFIAGPIVHLLNVDELFGELLFPIVSLSVAIILFEGGLTLRVKDLVEIGTVLRRLLTIGVVITWLLTAFMASLLLGFDQSLSLLVGAILIVTGPTVVIPLINQVRPSGRVASILRWEGIVIDPVGAVLAVLIFEAVRVAPTVGIEIVLFGLIKTTLIGSTLGYIVARLIILIIARHWIPDYLENPIVLFFTLFSFAISNYFQLESGLLTVTMMGIVLANQDLIIAGRFRLGGQHQVNIDHIVEFKEILQVLLVSGLFILLSARLHISELSQLGINVVIFVLVLILLVRPLAVWVCTLRTQLSWQERLFIAWMAPRGIVAAAVASIFALELIEHNYPDAELLAPVVFAVIIGTVVIYGLTSGWLAQQLGISQANPQGVLIIGAHDWARKIALAIQNVGIPVRLIDTNWAHIQQARMEGLPVYFGSILSDRISESLDLSGIGHVLALTGNDDVNSLACLKLERVFGRANVYQLLPSFDEKSRKQSVSAELRGRFLFDDERMHFDSFSDAFHHGASIKVTKLTPEFGIDAFYALNGANAILLFLIKAEGMLTIVTKQSDAKVHKKATIVSLVRNEIKE